MLKIRVLGRFEIRSDGQPIALRSRPAQSLLAYLLLHPATPHPRDKIAGLLWPDASEANARRSLRQALWALRKALGRAEQELLLVDDTAIGISPSADYWLDSAALEQTTGDAPSTDALLGAVEAYGGELLPGFYDNWVALERERLQAVFERRMAQLLERLIEARRWSESLDWAERWIALGSVPEPAYRALMIAHTALGNQSSAAAAYQRCVEALQKDLGVEPSAETRAIYERLARGESREAVRDEMVTPAPRTGDWAQAAPILVPEAGWLQGRYRLEGEIARGGMGIVQRAYDTLLDRTVAIKVLNQTGLEQQGHARLLREARMAARLNHPNIVAVYDVVEVEGVPCLIMELVEGESLYGRAPAAFDEVLAVARQVGAALDHAHSHGIVHSDLKPENILLCADGTVKLTDFGLARPAASRLSAEGSLAGTVFYLAPEQALGRPADARSDLYSLGVVLYEQATGRLPFTADDPLGVVSQHIHTQPTPPRSLRPDLLPGFETLVLKLLAKDPRDRYASADEVGRAVEELARPARPEPAASEVTPGEPPLPAFLASEAGAKDEERAPFVGREQEMKRLDEELQASLAGQSRIVFVVGEAGRGKSALMAEFARRAMAAHPDLIAAGGNCNAFSGAGEPFLPFRDLLGMLAGNVEARGLNWTLSQEQAWRLWHLLPESAPALIDHGPDLLDRIVPLAPLLSRARARAPDGAEWLAQLETFAGRATPRSGDPTPTSLFEQVAEVLRALAARRTLLLLLDDLQWADSASVNLLFHLGRRLPSARVMIVGAFRYSDVALGRPAGDGAEQRAHPLQSLIGELTRQFGDIQIDLDRAMAQEGRTFVDALLDREPNQLDEAFRARGHPLFTVELLKDMRARNDLVQDEAGRWVQRAALDWGALPARVEAVVEQRLSRLDSDLLELLSVASVEGEEFTAPVIAQVQKLDERQTLRRLSQELERRHGLVRERGEMAVAGRRLARFQFSHVLFQQVLYNRLGSGERRLLHGEVARALEEFGGEHAEAFAAPLARHYAEAGEAEKAVPRLLEAGDRARTLYAHHEAIAYYRRALAFLKEMGDNERAARTQMKLGLTHSLAFDFEQAREAYAAGFDLWQRVSERTAGALLPAPHALRTNWRDPDTLDPCLPKTIWSVSLAGQLFSGLATLNPELDVVPAVARAWEALDGGRRYVFHLRDDVRWSDGRPVTAHDFEYSWKRTLDPALEAGFPAFLLYDIRAARAFHQGEISDPSQIGVHAADDTTLVVELEVPAAYFIQLVAFPTTFPVPRWAVETHGRDWAQPGKIVTNGPFLVADWQPGRAMTLRRNPDYFGQWGNVERLELTLNAEPDDLLRSYDEGALDALHLWFLPPEIMDRARQRHAEEYLSGPQLLTYYLIFDTSRPPFDDARVRRALALAVDRQRLADVDQRGGLYPATGGLVPPGMPGHAAGLALPADIGQARRLLEEAGYPGGKGFPDIEIAINVGREHLCEPAAAQWREKLGIPIAVRGLADSDLGDAFANAQQHCYFGLWVTDYPDPDCFLRVCIEDDRSVMRWRDESYDSLIDEARRIADQGQRLQLYRKAEQILVDAVPILPLTYGRVHVLLKPWVKDYRLPMMKQQYWQDIVLEPHDRPAAEQTGVAASHTLRINWPDPETLDPAQVGIAYSALLAGQLFSGLVTITPELDVAPDVAESWEVLEGGRKYLFHLHEEAHWSDGRPVTAGDFKYAWKRALDPATGAFYAALLHDVRGARAFNEGETNDPDQVGVRAVDDRTLAVELEVPAAYFIQLVASPPTFPVPRHIVRAYGQARATVENIVTNGPFRPTAWQAGEKLVLECNRMYHGRRGNALRLELDLNAEPSHLLSAYEADRLDVLNLWRMPPPVIARARQHHTSEYLSRPWLRTYYLVFNLNRPPFDDLRVRRALVLAADRGRIAEVDMQSNVYPATGGFVPPGMPGHAPGIALPTDIEEARRLLAAAGYPGGQGLPLLEVLAARGREHLAERLLMQWRERLGVEFRLEALPMQTVDERQRAAPPHMYFGLWTAGHPDPDNFLRVCVAHVERSFMNWRNDAYDSLIEQARRLMDQAERMRIYQQAEQILVEEIPLLPIAYGRSHLLLKPWVMNYQVSMQMRQFWKDIVLDDSARR